MPQVEQQVFRKMKGKSNIFIVINVILYLLEIMREIEVNTAGS